MTEERRPIVNIADVPLRELAHGNDYAAKLGRIGPLIGAKQLGCQLRGEFFRLLGRRIRN